MRKETIIEIILSTMEEMRKLTETFADKENIPQPFIDLLMEKYTTLGKEIQLLEFWKEDAEQSASTVSVREEKREFVEVINKTGLEKVEIVEEAVEEAAKEEVKPVVVEPQPIVEEKREAIVEPKPVVEPKPIAAAKSISSKDAIEYGTPVSDIRRAIGINDRFLFQRELFGGDATKLNQTLDAINACTSFEEAHAMLKCFKWDETDATVEAFMKAVHRRFL
ncbi:MAG: hypothetical protein Q4C30_05765 [Bacteroidia bacterium]|nr:hypothetical protein [Bacteroidia bacterium]